MRLVLLQLFLLPFFATAQIIKDNSKDTDPNKMEIDKNIFRMLLSASTDTKFSFTASYERQIIRPLTIFLKGGPAFNREYVTIDAFGTEQYKWLFNVTASGELRYYYNLPGRIKKQRTVRNFSAFYLSLEELLISKPLFILNKSGDVELKGKNSAFINIGFQYQKNTTYFNVYFGTRFPGQVYNNPPVGIELLHTGIIVGLVL
ncbi:MAG: hypothetical protein ABJB86_18675 [Bacteroidota bacterium]